MKNVYRRSAFGFALPSAFISDSSSLTCFIIGDCASRILRRSLADSALCLPLRPVRLAALLACVGASRHGSQRFWPHPAFRAGDFDREGACREYEVRWSARQRPRPFWAGPAVVVVSVPGLEQFYRPWCDFPWGVNRWNKSSIKSAGGQTSH